MSKIDEIRQAAEQGIYIGILDDIEYLLRIAEAAEDFIDNIQPHGNVKRTSCCIEQLKKALEGDDCE